MRTFRGARVHLRNAASRLTAGAYADSVRESIHTVEAVGRTLEPSADVLSKALKKLEGRILIHPAMKNGLMSPYAYTSDEKGIRTRSWTIVRPMLMRPMLCLCSALARRLFRTLSTKPVRDYCEERC